MQETQNYFVCLCNYHFSEMRTENCTTYCEAGLRIYVVENIYRLIRLTAIRGRIKLPKQVLTF